MSKERSKSQVKESMQGSEVYGDWNEMLGMALNTEENATTDDGAVVSRGKSGPDGYEEVTVVEWDPGSLPNILYFVGERQGDRLFQVDAEGMLFPFDYFARATHGVVLSGDVDKISTWSECAYRDIPRNLKRFGKKAPYAKRSVHARCERGWNASSEYLFLGRDGKWRLCPMKNPAGRTGSKLGLLYQNIVLGTSAVEDILCTGLVAIQNTTHSRTGVFMADNDARGEIATLRDGPISGGRRSPINHWVGKHFRRMQDGGKSEVQGHLRGIDVFEVDDWRILTMLPLPVMWKRSPEYAMGTAASALAYLGAKPNSMDLDALHELGEAEIEYPGTVQAALDARSGPEDTGQNFGFMAKWLASCAILAAKGIDTLDKAIRADLPLRGMWRSEGSRKGECK